MTLSIGRKRNTTRDGRAFDDITTMQVWAKGAVDAVLDPKQWRRDMCGKLMSFRSYGDTNSIYGWEIDHILPLSKGGSDHNSNLQPLQWENNRTKGDSYPWFCW